MKLIALISLLSCISACFCQTFYFSHAPQEIPSNFTTWEYNGASGDLKMLSTGLEEAYTAYEFVSGAATCGGRYYASAVDPPMDAGLMVVEIQTGKTEILDWNNSPALKSMNLHNMYCDPEDKNGQTLYVVENVIDGTQSYSVWKMKIDPDYKVTQDKIADFPLNAKMVPTAYDTEFQITPDLKTVYSLWTTKQASASFVISVDLESGSTKTYTLESG